MTRARRRPSAADLGPLGEDRGDDERPEEPDADEKHRRVGIQRRRLLAATLECRTGCDHGVGDVEREVLDDVGQEDRRELLAEVEGDPRADPRQLAAGDGRDREPERAFLDDRDRAAKELLGQAAQRLRVVEPGRRNAGQPAAGEGRDDADQERRQEPDRDDGGDRGERQQHVAAAALAARDGVLERPPRPFRARDRRAVDDREQAAEPKEEREDRVVGRGKCDERQRRGPLGDARAGAVRRSANGNEDQREEPAQERERQPRRQAAEELPEPGREEPHDGVSALRSVRVPAPAAPKLAAMPGSWDPPVSSRNSISRSLPDSSPIAQIPAPPSARFTSAVPSTVELMEIQPSSSALARTSSGPASEARTVVARSTSSATTRTRISPSALSRSLIRPSRTSLPAAMMPTTSAICWTSARRWLDTRTVLPSAARRRSVSRMATMPAGSSPFAGSSRSSSVGSLRSAPAIPRRCFIPSE